jgi:hypothetical protein
MPGGDRTGPTGMGPMTGRGAGYCGGAAAPGFMNLAPGRGFRGGRGRGFGRGRGWRQGFYASWGPGWGCWRPGPWAYGPPPTSGVTREEELGALRAQAEHLQGLLGDIQRRIEEIQRPKET